MAENQWVTGVLSPYLQLVGAHLVDDSFCEQQKRLKETDLLAADTCSPNPTTQCQSFQSFFQGEQMVNRHNSERATRVILF